MSEGSRAGVSIDPRSDPGPANSDGETLGWRFKAGVAIFVLAFAIWLLVPVATLLNVAGTWIAAVTSAVFLANKALLLLCVGVMGKAGFYELKRRALRYVSQLAPTTIVGPVRHRVGVGMLGLALASSIGGPYVDYLAPGLYESRWELQVAEDLLLVASFFVLGGNFWDKVRALFVRTARVIETDEASVCN